MEFSSQREIYIENAFRCLSRKTWCLFNIFARECFLYFVNTSAQNASIFVVVVIVEMNRNEERKPLRERVYAYEDVPNSLGW